MQKNAQIFTVQFCTRSHLLQGASWYSKYIFRLQNEMLFKGEKGGQSYFVELNWIEFLFSLLHASISTGMKNYKLESSTFLSFLKQIPTVISKKRETATVVKLSFRHHHTFLPTKSLRYSCFHLGSFIHMNCIIVSRFWPWL